MPTSDTRATRFQGPRCAPRLVVCTALLFGCPSPTLTPISSSVNPANTTPVSTPIPPPLPTAPTPASWLTFDSTECVLPEATEPPGTLTPGPWGGVAGTDIAWVDASSYVIGAHGFSEQTIGASWAVHGDFTDPSPYFTPFLSDEDREPFDVDRHRHGETVAAGDFDGDGAVDVIIGQVDGDDGWVGPDSFAFFAPSLPSPGYSGVDDGFELNGSGWQLQRCDVDGDGQDDLCSTLSVRLGPFSAPFSPPERVMTDPSPLDRFATADVDGDGADEVLVRDASEGLVGVYHGVEPAPRQLFEIPSGFGDLWSDGEQLVVVSRVGDQLEVRGGRLDEPSSTFAITYTHPGAGAAFDEASPAAMLAAPRVAGADLDGDGHTDLMVAFRGHVVVVPGPVTTSTCPRLTWTHESGELMGLGTAMHSHSTPSGEVVALSVPTASSSWYEGGVFFVDVGNVVFPEVP